MARDKPNKKCNRYLKARLTRVGGTIFRECKRTTREDDLYVYARKLKDGGLAYKKVAAKVGRKIFRILREGIAYDGDVEKQAGSDPASQARSGAAKRRQRYQRERAARLAAERTTDALENLLRDLGVAEARVRAIRVLDPGR